jgi:hypothetical protein
MPIETALPKNDPMMIAWESYVSLAEYKNTRSWAKHDEHVDGSLWAAFVAGWKASEAEAASSKTPC